ncbi:MAG: hypothetical protein JO127_02755 [Caulobacteraceae bacterium]|nr:hypothetical protein [Caulobacteraceae bacterium]
MAKYLPQILIGVAVAFVVSLLLAVVAGPGPEGPVLGAMMGAFTAYILANLAGNRKVAAASAAEREAALSFQPPEGKALAYLYREGFVAKAAGMNLSVDGREVVQLKSPRFTRLVLSPGRHVLVAGFGGLAGAQSKPATYDLDAKAGEVTILKIGAAMGLVQGNITITPADDLAAAKTRLSGMTMIAAEPAEA